MKRIKQILVVACMICLFWMIGSQDAKAADDGDYAWSNLSVYMCEDSSGCQSTNVYAHCYFYCNFWNPNRNVKMNSATVTIKNSSGETVFSDSFSGERGKYYGYIYIPIHLKNPGVYTLERSVKTLDGDTLKWDPLNFTLKDVKECGSKLSLNAQKVSLNMTDNKSKTITVKVTGIMPVECGVRYSCSNENVSCTWGKWYDSDNDGLTDACNLTISGEKAGSCDITISFYEGTTNAIIDKKSITVTIGAEYVVAYDANGGSGAPSKQKKQHGKALTLSSTKPTRNGYTFQGWGTNANDTTVDYKPGEKYTKNKDIKLYAIWTKEQKITASNISKVVSSSKRTIAINAKCSGNAKLTYKSNNKNITVDSNGKITIKKNYIGKATITITAGKTTKKISVTVKPQKASITLLKKQDKKILLKNKKNIGNVTYQIEYATNSKFNSSTKHTNVDYSNKGYYIVKNPKKNKTYYVRIRGMKKVNGTIYYGTWSDVSKIKIK